MRLGEQFPSISWRCTAAKTKTMIDFCFPTMSLNEMLFCLWLTDGQKLDIVHGATKGCECRARRVRGWLLTNEPRWVYVLFGWAMVWFHGWCQDLCHSRYDPSFAVLKGNGSPLTIKYWSISVHLERWCVARTPYNSCVEPPLSTSTSLERCEVEFLHNCN